MEHTIPKVPIIPQEESSGQSQKYRLVPETALPSINQGLTLKSSGIKVVVNIIDFPSWFGCGDKICIIEQYELFTYHMYNAKGLYIIYYKIRLLLVMKTEILFCIKIKPICERCL